MITDLKINEDQKKYYYDKGYWTEKSLNDVWTTQASRYSDRLYVSDDQGSRFTYGDVEYQAARLASWLKEQGVGNGDVVTFQIPTWSEFCVVYVACLKVGAVMHPLARTFNGEDLVFGMNLVGSKAFICPTFFHKTDFELQILEVKNRIPTLKSIALIDKISEKHNADIPTLAEIVRDYEPLTVAPESSADDVALILSTSGTTGKPKAVLLTHNNLIFSESSFVTGLELTQDDVMFMPAPLNHATGFNHGLISPLLLGGRVVLQQEFHPKDSIKIINEEGVTWSMGATPFIFDLLNTMDEDGTSTPSLRLYLCGGAPVPGSMVQRADEHGILLCEVYGSTESCPHIFVPPSKALEWNGAWSGVAFPGIEVRVVDDFGNPVPNGTQGEEVSRGPHQFVGYLNNPEATDATLDDEGWFYSGDLCYMDDEGRVRINGRKKEILIRGGVNISANEVDENVTGCPGIGDHATIGLPDDRLGERICLFAVASGDTQPSIDDIAAYLDEKHVAKRLRPEHVEYIDEIPHTESGKVKRHQLADVLAERMKQPGWTA